MKTLRSAHDFRDGTLFRDYEIYLTTPYKMLNKTNLQRLYRVSFPI